MVATKKNTAKPVFYNLKSQTVLTFEYVERYRENGKLKLPKDIHKFDSTHEFKVYLHLIRMYGVRRVMLQHRIPVVPKGLCYPGGKNWRVDFAINNYPNLHRIDYIVEAKGIFTTEFAYTLALLEQNDPESFSKLRVVFCKTLPTKNRIITALLKTDYRENLLTLSELKQLQRLP